MKGYLVICMLAVAYAAASASAAQRPADGRLAYLQSMDKGCRAGVWDSKSGTARVLGDLPECPAAVSVTSREQALVLIFPASIRLVELGSGKIGDAIPMPADAIAQGHRDDEASLAGYTADGTLALRLRGIKPDNSGIGQLFLYKQGAWKKVAERSCGDYDECIMQPAIQARQLDDIYGLGPNGLFNESLTDDPYVVKRSSRDARPDAEADSPPDESIYPADVTLSFRVDGKESQLLFDTAPGEDAGGIYTFRLKLVLPDKRTVAITTEQFGAALVGHYLFVHGFFDEGIRLYDVGNGKVILDKLSTGGWLEPRPSP